MTGGVCISTRQTVIYYSWVSTCIESSQYFWETIANVRLYLMTNIFWLASYFSQIKKRNRHFSGNQKVTASVRIFDTIFYFYPQVIFWFELQLANLQGTREIYKIERYRVNECSSEMVLCPILWGINLSHIYACEVRWNFEFDSWYSSKICPCLSKKNWHS